MEGTARQITDRLLVSRKRERGEQAFQLACVAELIDRYQLVPALNVPGAERLVPAGGDGAPLVAEFLAAELGPLLGESIPTTWNLIHDTANLRFRHPRLWGLVQDGLVPVWQARRAAAMCAEADLSLAASDWVDERMQSAWGRLAWGRLLRRLRGLIVAADRELAAQRAEAKKRERFVSISHEGDGSSFLAARLDTADAVRVGEAISAIARDLAASGRPEPMPELRAEALGLLAQPTDGGALPRPDATLVVHVARETLADGDGVARDDVLGPLLLAQVTELLAHHWVRVVPVIDLAGDPAVDSYEIPDRMREQVLIRDRFSTFPFSSARARLCDADHTVTFDHGDAQRPRPPGQTRPSNLGPLGRREHRPKTFAGFLVNQTSPGAFEWRSPLGYRYRVDAAGTHVVHEPSASVVERVLRTTIAEWKDRHAG